MYFGITALSILGLTDRISESIEFTIPKGSRVRKENVGYNAICLIENNIKLFELAKLIPICEGSEVIFEEKGQRPGFSFSIRKNAEDRREGVSGFGGDGLWELTKILSARVLNITKEKGISANVVYSRYFFDCFLKRLSLSPYSEKFEIKWCFLIPFQSVVWLKWFFYMRFKMRAVFFVENDEKCS